jgi:hypothetical protein
MDGMDESISGEGSLRFATARATRLRYQKDGLSNTGRGSLLGAERARRVKA